MNPENQRIAIAEACEWRYHPKAPLDIKEAAIMCWIRPGNADWQTEELPDYLNDLNAMHEAEKVLTIGQRIEYCREVGFIFTGRNDMAIPNWWLLHDATAAQRAEAFLRAIGKWEDE